MGLRGNTLGAPVVKPHDYLVNRARYALPRSPLLAWHNGASDFSVG